MVSSHVSHVPHGVGIPAQFVSVPFRLIQSDCKLAVAASTTSVVVPPGARLSHAVFGSPITVPARDVVALTELVVAHETERAVAAVEHRHAVVDRRGDEPVGHRRPERAERRVVKPAAAPARGRPATSPDARGASVHGPPLHRLGPGLAVAIHQHRARHRGAEHPHPDELPAVDLAAPVPRRPRRRRGHHRDEPCPRFPLPQADRAADGTRRPVSLPVNCRQSTDARSAGQARTMALARWIRRRRTSGSCWPGCRRATSMGRSRSAACAGRVVLPAGSPGDLDRGTARARTVLLMISGHDAVPAATWRATLVRRDRAGRRRLPRRPPAVLARGPTGRRRARTARPTMTTTRTRTTPARSPTSRWNGSNRSPSRNGSSRTSWCASRSVAAGRSSRARPA